MEVEAEEEADEEMEEQGDEGQGGAQLQFNKPLTWKAGRSIALTELLKRLEALSKELQGYEQDEVERESLFGVARELASQQLLTHKDRGVKAFTACCVVDIFRLCAPDAPYTAAQMKVSLRAAHACHEKGSHVNRTSSRSSFILSSLI
jgi:sister-chromatid-cohesion protein PDS5